MAGPDHVRGAWWLGGRTEGKETSCSVLWALGAFNHLNKQLIHKASILQKASERGRVGMDDSRLVESGAMCACLRRGAQI